LQKNTSECNGDRVKGFSSNIKGAAKILSVPCGYVDIFKIERTQKLALKLKYKSFSSNLKF
jgi:hypothetical protein